MYVYIYKFFSILIINREHSIEIDTTPKHKMIIILHIQFYFSTVTEIKHNHLNSYQ